MMIHLTYQITILTQVLIIFFVGTQLTSPKRGYIFTATVLYLPILAFYIIFNFILHMPNASLIHVILRNGSVFVCFQLLYKGSFLRKAFIWGMFYTLLAGSELVLMPIMCWEFGIKVEALTVMSEVLPFGQMLINDLGLSLCIIFCFFYRRGENRLRSFTQQYLMLIGVAVLHMIFLIFYYRDNSVIENSRNNLIQVLMQNLILLAYIFQYFAAVRNQRLMTENAELNDLRAKMEHTYEYYKLADERFSDISRLRHDLLSQLSTVENLLSADETVDTAKELMSEIRRKTLATRAVQYCDINLINSVLTVKMNDPRTTGIDITILLRDCGSVPLDNYELCSLFSNLFDNALEGCLALGEDRERFIDMKSAVKGDMFILKVTNSCVPMETHKRGLPRTTKSEDGHGLGLKIIDSIAKKYDGSFEIIPESGTFTAIVSISTKSPKSQNNSQ